MMKRKRRKVLAFRHFLFRVVSSYFLNCHCEEGEARRSNLKIGIASLALAVLVIIFTANIPTAAAERAAINKSVKTNCAEEDNIDYPVYGDYVSAYRINALFPTFYPLDVNQKDLCVADWEDCELAQYPNPNVAYIDTANKLKLIPKSPGAEWWYPTEDIDSSGNSIQYVSMGDPPSVAYYDATNKTLKYRYRIFGGYSGSKIIDDSGSARVGLYASMVLDSAKSPHIAYYDIDNKKLKYIRRTGLTWPASADDVANMGDVTKYPYEYSGFRCISLTVDSSDNPHIVYYDANDGRLKYTYKSGANWTAPVTVDSSSNVGWYISSAMDISTNVLHVAYYDVTNGYLKYVKKTGSSWVGMTNLDTDNKIIADVNEAPLSSDPEKQKEDWVKHVVPNKPGQMVSLALDSTGFPHIAYSDDRSLKYIYSSSGGWKPRQVIGQAAKFVSLAVDSGNYPHIAYYDNIGQRLLYIYRSKKTTYWNTPENPDPDTKKKPRLTGFYPSLSLDSKNYPHITYYDIENHTLKYVSKTLYGWSQSEVIDNGGGSNYVGLYASMKLEIDLEGKPLFHISYYDLTLGALKYAYKGDLTYQAARWISAETPDSSPDVGQYTSLAWDYVGSPGIAYYDVTNGHLRYAFKERNQVWKAIDLSTDMGITGDVGRYAALAFDRYNRAHIAFYDSTNKKLRYVWQTGAGGWSGVETPDTSTDDIGKYLSMKLDPLGFPSIAYYDVTNKRLKYVTKTSSGWATPQVLETFATGYAAEGKYISMDIWWEKMDHKEELPKHRAPKIAYVTPDGTLKFIYNLSNLIQQAEAGYTVISGVFNKVERKEAMSKYVLRGAGPTKEGEVSYSVNFDRNWTNARMSLRYSALYKTQTGGVEVYVDGVSKGKFGLEATEGFEIFKEAMMPLGNISSGAHTIKLKVMPGPDNNVLELDYWTLLSDDWSAPVADVTRSGAGKYVSLALDFLGFPHIVYYAGSTLNYTFMFRYESATGEKLSRWADSEVIASDVDVHKYVSIEAIHPNFVAPPPPSPGVIYDDGNVRVSAYYGWGWWRPHGMSVNVKGGKSLPDADFPDKVNFIVITKRIPDTVDEFPENFVMYSDGYTRLIPQPPTDRPVDQFVCYGASIIIGPVRRISPSVVQDRPFADVKHIDVDPTTLTLNVDYMDGGSSRLDMFPERKKLTLNVTGINYNSFYNNEYSDEPLMDYRSMWVSEGKNDVEYVKGADGKEWPVGSVVDGGPAKLPGNYWKFYRKAYSTHNTSAPDFELEILGPDRFIFTEVENYNSINAPLGTVTKVSRNTPSKDMASGGKTVKVTGQADLIYNLNFNPEMLVAVFDLRYTDDKGGGKIEVYLDGNKIDLYPDDAMKSDFISESTGALGVYKKSGQLPLPLLISYGAHNLTLKVIQGASNLELDYFAIHPKVDVVPLTERPFDDIMFDNAVWFAADPKEPLQYELDLANKERSHGTKDDFALKVVFDKSKATDADFGGDHQMGEAMRKYGYFGAKIPATDFFKHDYFSFWVYNDGTPLKFRIRLEDDSPAAERKRTIGGETVEFGIWESNWARIEPHTITDAPDWENLVVDLSRAFSAHDSNWRNNPFLTTGKLDLSRIATIAFIVAPENDKAAGTFWMDDFMLSRATETAPLDAFESDYYGWSGGKPSDIEFLDKIEEDSFKYFWYEVNPKNGLIKDGSWAAKESSIAAIGFGLTAYCIGAERGWIIRDQAKQRVRTVLKTLYNAPQGPEATGKAGYKGFFYHFLKMSDATRDGTSELSSIDTALLMAGVLTCKQYFNNATDSDEYEIRDFAKKLYERVDWKWMLNGASTLSMGWMPESGFLPSRWQGYNESMILYLLAIGSPTTHSNPARLIPASSWSAANWKRDYGTYGGHSLYYVSTGSLFAYQFSHAWIDFSGKTVDGVDWFNNSKEAFLANKQFCIDNAATYKTYGSDSWGLSASVTYGTRTVDPITGKVTYDGEEYKAFGAKPSSGEPLHEGVIAPYAAAGSIIFGDQHVIPALKYFYKFKDDLYREYGFLDAFRLDTAPVFVGEKATADGWFSTQYLGIDQGITVLMIENYRSGFVYNYFMKNSEITNAMTAVGFSNTGINFEPQGRDAVYDPLVMVLGTFPDWIEGFNLGISETDGVFLNKGEYEAADSSGITHLGNHALRVKWTVKNVALSNFVYALHHDKDLAPSGRIGNYTDLTLNGNNTISMWVKSNTDPDFKIRAAIFWDEPGVDDQTGLPDPNDEGEGQDLGDATYAGAGNWQELTWSYEKYLDKAKDIKVIYFFPKPLVADYDGGTMYVDNFSLINLPDIEGAAIFSGFLDDLIAALTEKENEYEVLIGALALTSAAAMPSAAAAKHVAMKMKAGLSLYKGEVVTFRQTWTSVVRKYPRMSYYGLYVLFSFNMAYFTDYIFTEGHEFGTYGEGLQWGWFGAHMLASYNLSKVMVNFLHSRFTETVIFPEAANIVSGGVPKSKQIALIVPFFPPGYPEKLGDTAKDIAENTLKRAEAMEEVQMTLDNLKTWALKNKDPNIIFGIGLDGPLDDWNKADRPLGKLIKGIKDLNLDPALNGAEFFVLSREPTMAVEKIKIDSFRAKIFNALGLPFGEMKPAGNKGWWLKPGWQQHFRALLNGDFNFLGKAHPLDNDNVDLSGFYKSADDVAKIGPGGRYNAVLTKNIEIKKGGAGSIPQVITDSRYVYFSDNNNSPKSVDLLKCLLAKLEHPSNKNPDGSLKRAIAGQAMAASDDLLTQEGVKWWKTMFSWDRIQARYQERFNFVQEAFNGVFTGQGTYYGKALENPKETHRLFKDVLSGFNMSHDIPEGAMAKIMSVLDLYLYDDTPRNAFAGGIREGRWSWGDYTLGKFSRHTNWILGNPYYRNKVRTGTGKWITNPVGSIGSLQLADNIVSRLSNVGLLGFAAGGLWMKTHPDILALGGDPDYLASLYVGTILAYVSLPMIASKAKYGIPYSASDIILTSMIQSANVFAEAQNFAISSVRMMYHKLYNIPWISAATANRRVSMGKAMKRGALAFTAATIGAGYSIYSGYDITPFETMMYTSWWLSGPLTWLTDEENLQSIVDSKIVQYSKRLKGKIEDESAAFARLIKAGFKLGIIKDDSKKLIPPLDVPPALIVDEVAEALKVTYDYTAGARLTLSYKGVLAAALSYKQSSDPYFKAIMLEDIMFDGNTMSQMASLLSEDEAALWLIIKSYRQINDADRLLEVPVGINKFVVKKTVSAKILNVLDIMAAKGYLHPRANFLTDFFSYGIKDLSSASFLLSGMGKAGLYVVEGTGALKSLIFNEIRLIAKGIFKGKLFRVTKDGKIIIEYEDAITKKKDVYTLDKDLLVEKAGGELEFKLQNGDDSIAKTLKLTNTQLTFVEDGISISLENNEFVFKEVNPDSKLAAKNKKFITKITSATEAAADDIIAKMGGLGERVGGAGKFDKLVLSVNNGELKVALDSHELGIQIELPSWDYLRNKLTNNKWKIWGQVKGVQEVVGVIILESEPGKITKSGKVITRAANVAFEDNIMNAFNDEIDNLIDYRISPTEAKPLIVEYTYTGGQGRYFERVEGGIPQVEPRSAKGRALSELADPRMEIINEHMVDSTGRLHVNSIVLGREDVTPGLLRKIAGKSSNFLKTSTVGQVAVFCGAIHSAIIIYKYKTDAYETPDALLGDVVYGAADTAAWTATQFAVERAAAQLGLRAAAVSFTGSVIWTIPLIVPIDGVINFGTNLYYQITSEADIDPLAAKLNDLSGKLESSGSETGNDVYRAWLLTIDYMNQNWRNLGLPYGSQVRSLIEKVIADNLQERWLASGDPIAKESQDAWDELLSIAAEYDEQKMTPTPEILEPLEKKAEKAMTHYNNMLTLHAKLYGAEYQAKIIDALYNGLSWDGWGIAPIYDEYGQIRGMCDLRSSCPSLDVYITYYPFIETTPLANPGPPPLDLETADFNAAVQNAAEVMKKKLMEKIYELWRTYSEGRPGLIGKLDPIETYLGRRYTLEELRILTLMEIDATINQLRSYLDGSWNSMFGAEAKYKPIYVVALGLPPPGKWLDVRTALPTLEALSEKLSTANFLEIGIYTSVLPNTDFEFPAKEYNLAATYKIEPPQTTFTLGGVVFDGVRYYWDIRAYNKWFRESPVSERWNFIGKD